MRKICIVILICLLVALCGCGQDGQMTNSEAAPTKEDYMAVVMKLYEEYELEKYGIKGYDVDISYENPEYSEIFQMPLDEYEELMRKEFDEIVEQQERYFPASIDNG